MNISIIGLGLIGGSLAKAIKNVRPDVVISAYDLPEVISLALSEKVIDEKLLNVQSAKDSDIIFLCLPIELSIQQLEVLAPLVKSGSIITDVCSVKSVLKEKWNSLRSSGIYVGGHPMTGKEKGGYENSDPILFENAIYILTDEIEADSRKNKLVELLSSIGANIRFLNASLHDTIVAHVSHLPQLVAVAIVNAALKDEQASFKDFAAGGFRDLTRIASSDYGIWEQIIRSNREQILTALSHFQSTVQNITDAIAQNDFSFLQSSFEEAKIKRDEIPKNSKGFINQLSDIFVFVKDEPGVLHKLTTILYQNGISIKDIELLKIREGTGGTFRLSFASEEIAAKAKGFIESIGFKTR